MDEPKQFPSLFRMIVQSLQALGQTKGIDIRRHWPFESLAGSFEVHLPFVIRDSDETRAWINFHDGSRRFTGSGPIFVSVITGGPIVLKDESTGTWVRRVDFQMKPGDNHTLILQADPIWEAPNCAATNFVFSGTLVAEIPEIGDSRGVDIAIERNVISVIFSSLATLKRLGPISAISSSVATLLTLGYIFLSKPIPINRSDLPQIAAGLVTAGSFLWLVINWLRKHAELKERLLSNVDYLSLINATKQTLQK